LSPGGAAESAAEPAADGRWALPELPAGTTDTAQAEPPRSESEAAYARGYAEGLHAGESGARDQVRAAVGVLAEVVERLLESEAQFALDRAHNLEGLAMAVARKLVEREVAADPTLVRSLVERALELLPAEMAIQVRMNPADLAALQGGLEAAGASGPAATPRWIADPAFGRGSFVVEGPQRIVDGRTDAALRTLYERLEHD
jgi:flagellar assembly protein FliH/type III secretion protein L